MKYVLLLYWNEAIVSKFTPEDYKEATKAWNAVATDMTAAGVLESTNGLSSVSNATTVRVRDGKTVAADGPFAETHEQLGGCWVLNCKDLDEAIGWAAKIPSATYGSIEIRPTWAQN